MNRIDKPALALQLAQQVEDLRLDRHVQRRRRLVGDQQPRARRQRHRDHHALAHAAGHFVRIGIDALLRRAGSRPAGTARCASLPRLCGRHAAALRRTSPTWRPTRMTGLSAVIGSWKIIARSRPRRRRQPRPAGQRDPRRRAGCGRGAGGSRCGSSPMMLKRQHALAGAGFADDAEHLARRDGERHVLEDLSDPPASARSFSPSTASSAPCGHQTFMRGSRTSRRPSPSRLRPSTRDHDGEPGEDRDPRRLAHEVAPLRDDADRRSASAAAARRR